MDSLISSLENIIAWVIPVTWILVAVALVACGICMAIGGQKLAETAKAWLPRIAVGAILILGATTLADEFISNLTF